MLPTNTRRLVRCGLSLLISLPALGHGGIHRGPGDVVPPGEALRAAAPQRSQFIMCSPAGNATGESGADLTRWDFWWAFRMERYLPTWRIRQTSTPVEPWLSPATGQSEAIRRPSPVDVTETIVPALFRVVREDPDPSLVAGALIALAKIGEVDAAVLDTRALLVDRLRSPSQTVSEAAALALGILGEPPATPVLDALAHDSSEGRELVRRPAVPVRTRTFAAFGLGLLGQRAADPALRRDVVRALCALVSGGPSDTPDLKAAAVTAIGLVPLEVASAPGDPRRAHSREDQLAFLLAVFDAARGPTNDAPDPWFVRAHAAAAMGRLLEGAPESCREDVAAALLAAVARGSGEREEIRGAAALALGQVGDASDEGRRDVDVLVREELLRLVADGAPQTRRFALVSLARCAARPDAGATGRDAVAEVTDALVKTLETGKSGLKPWAGFALGVLCRELQDRGRAPSEEALAALVDAARDCRRPAEIGAYALALGIAGHREAREVIRERLEHFDGSGEAQGYCALALGLLGDARDVDVVAEHVEQADERSAVLREGTLALGCFATRRSVPRLLESLDFIPRPCVQAAAALSLGWSGDAGVVAPLLERLADRSLPERTRAYAAAALGVLCDRNAERWGALLARELPYRASTTTMCGEGGLGVLGLL